MWYILINNELLNFLFKWCSGYYFENNLKYYELKQLAILILTGSIYIDFYCSETALIWFYGYIR